MKAVLDYPTILAEWEKFFREIHKTKVDFAGIDIPEPEVDDNEHFWLSCIPGNFSTQRVYGGGMEQYSKEKFSDESLDEILDLSFGRDAWNRPYIIRLQPNWEADEDLRDLSANMITERRINTATLKERCLLGDFLYWKHRKHLDSKSWTLCSGSRYWANGRVPFVCWRSDCQEMRVEDCHPALHNDLLRPRRVIA